MANPQLFEVVVPTDRWWVRAVSPVDIRGGVEEDAATPIVLVNPGWAKSPERHAALLHDLADAGFLSIGVDTRYGYADRGQHERSRRFGQLVTQSYRVGKANPYFSVSGQDGNRWKYRRPTALLHLCDRLGIVQRSLVGHSEGGRIATMAALGAIDKTDQLIVVSGAGTGSSANGYARLMKSNLNRVKDFSGGEEGVFQATTSAFGSIAYGFAHLRRTLAEKRVIQTTNLWEVLDQIESSGVPITVLHARDDELIAFKDSQRQASARPWVEFVPTEGNHSNVYSSAVRQLIVETLLADSSLTQ